MEFLRNVATLAWKDLRVEFRSREILYTMTFFGAMVLLIFSFAFVKEDGSVPDVVPGMLWVAVTFAGTLGLGRAFDREREGDTMRALLLSPAPRLAVFAGKTVTIALLVLAVQAAALPLCLLFFNVDPGGALLQLLLTLILGAIGFAVVGTVFAAMLLRVRSRDVLLPVVLYPILVPMIMAGTKATAAILPVGGTADLVGAYFWIRFLLVYDAIFVVVALWTFESLVIE